MKKLSEIKWYWRYLCIGLGVAAVVLALVCLSTLT